MEEKRNFKRFDRKVPAKLQSLGTDLEKNNKIHYLMTKDICAGGTYIMAKHPLPEGTEVLVEIALPIENSLNFDTDNHCLVKVKGHVLRSESAGMAVSFQKNFQIEFRELPPFLLDTPSSNN
jgi:hypothetical protein